MKTTHHLTFTPHDWAKNWLRNNGYRNAYWALALVARRKSTPKRVKQYAEDMKAAFIAGTVGMETNVYEPDAPHFDELSGFVIL